MRRVVPVFLVPALLVPVLLVAVATVAPVASAREAAGSAASPSVLADCLGKPEVKPAEIILACGDGNAAVEDITWVGWGSSFAAGKGTATINDCKPSCVAGHAHSYPVVVLVSGSQTCSPSGKTAYTTLTLAFLDRKPHITGSQTFPCKLR